MKKLSFLLSVMGCFLLAAIGCGKKTSVGPAGYSPPATPEKGSYTNPVFNHDFPDPNLIKAPDGFFYAYSTEADWSGDGVAGGRRFMPILKSADLMKWEIAGSVLNEKPGWKSEGGLWAPDATLYKGQCYVYYSYSTWGDPNPGIGLAVSDKPAGPFTDKGKVFLSKEIAVDNSIDPFLLEDGGKLYLFWGSFHGIYGVELSEDGTRTVGEKFQIGGNAYEATFIHKKGNYYYFIGSWGSCCEGARSTYRLMVARSSSLKGPYLSKDGKNLLDNNATLLLQANGGNAGFVGTGHNGDIFTDKNGTDWMLYHAFDKVKADKRVMLLDKITWTPDGWPEIKDKEPTYTSQKWPVF